MIPCRLLPHESGDGPANMALDETLLEIVAQNPRVSVVRTYEWSSPTLSLGYFQSFAATKAEPRWAGRALVRRPTGGGALWHDHEITYAIVIPATHPFARPSTTLYRAVHTAIATQMRAAGIAARTRGCETVKPQAGTDRPFLCFQDQDAEDVVVGAVKLVGSAQRRRAGAVLQHGSILLARSATTPELPGLSDLNEPEIPLVPADPLDRTWIEVLRSILPTILGDQVFEEEFSYSERAHADLIRREIYENPAWTERR